jgi:DNA invertase Pin-like site-specific DNA recombinase
MIIGYARLVAEDQNLDAQEGRSPERRSGACFHRQGQRERPELSRLFDQPRDGGVVVMTKSNRGARSLTSCVSSRTKTAGWASARWRRTSTRLDARLDEHEMNWGFRSE